MAFNHQVALFLSAFFVFSATTTQVVHGLGFGTLGLNTLTVTGQVCCTPTGNCAAGSVGLVGATVNLVCPSFFFPFVPTTVATTTTSATGTFTLTVNGASSLTNYLILYTQCQVVVPLPVAGCASPATGVFRSGIIVTSNTGNFLFPGTITAVPSGFTNTAS